MEVWAGAPGAPFGSLGATIGSSGLGEWTLPGGRNELFPRSPEVWPGRRRRAHSVTESSFSLSAPGGREALSPINTF